MALRVLHVTDNALGGLGTVLANFVPRQLAAGLAVAVAAPGNDLTARLASDGAEPFLWTATPAPGPSLPAELRSLHRILHAARPDVVHLHSEKAGLIGRLLLRGRLPTVFTPHAWAFLDKTGVLGQAVVAWERAAARWTDAILCVGTDERRLGEEAGVHARFVVAPNGVDLERFPAPDPADRARVRGRLGLARDRPIGVCVGRLHRQKNQGVLLEAWPGVRTRIADAQLILVGDGPDRRDLEARAVAGVTFVGLQEDVRPWLLAADVVLQPSRWEGSPLAPLEAMASARSVVATDVPAMREIIGSGNGAIVRPGDTAGLAEAVVERLGNRELAAREGAAGRALVERERDVRRQVETVDALYAELVSARAARSARG